MERTNTSAFLCVTLAGIVLEHRVPGVIAEITRLLFHMQIRMLPQRAVQGLTSPTASVLTHPRYLPARPFAGGHMVCGRVYHPASLSLSPLWGLFCFALFLFCFQMVSTTASPCLRHPGLRVPSRSPLRPLALSAARGGALCPGEGCPGCHQLILMACLRPQASGNGGTQRELRVTNILGPVCTPQEVSLSLSLTSAEGRNSWNRDAGCKKVHNL